MPTNSFRKDLFTFGALMTAINDGNQETARVSAA